MKYLGIDWASRFHDAALLDPEGKLLDRWRFPHDASGVAALLGRMQQEGGPTHVLVAVESGAPLLLDQLLAAGYTVFAINPKQADRYRDRHTVAGAKDDRLDAIVLADAVRTDHARLRPVARDSDAVEEARIRDRARTRKVEQRTRLCNQLRHVLGRYFPAMLELKRDMYDPFFLELLRTYPDPQAARAGRIPRLQRLIKAHRIRALSAPQLAERLRAPGLTAPAYVMSACRDEALDVAAQLQLLNEQIAAEEQRLDELLESHPDRELLQSLPGLGSRLSARVQAELGDRRDRYAERSILQALAGTAPVTRRSGRRGVISIHMRRGCNRTLQAAFFAMARASLPRSRWARAWYDQARARGVRHATAIRTLSNKWAKIVAAVIRTRQAYDEARHVDRLLQNGVTWAKDLAGTIAA